MRRVVTDIDTEGRSYFLQDGEISAKFGMADLWFTSVNQPLGEDPRNAKLELDPPSGGTQWRVVDLPPDEILMPIFAKGVPGHDSNGFHTTKSIDFVILLEGELTLELDSGAIDLKPGDVVVQRATRHAWRNRSSRTARIAAVMIHVPEDTAT